MIIVLGDAIIDEYVELETVRKCPEGDWPIVREVNRYTRHGGALAVKNMVSEHDCECRGLFGFTRAVKSRVSVDGTIVHRIDCDKTSEPVRASLTQCSVALVADYGKGSISRETIKDCIELGWKVIVDPHPTQDPSVYHGCWAICPNRAENRQHDFLNDDAFPRVCLKLDKDGMVIKDGDSIMAIHSTINQPPYDVCCAGDRVLATIGAMLQSGLDWADSCIAANYAAGLQCGRRGADQLTPEEIRTVTQGRYPPAHIYDAARLISCCSSSRSTDRHGTGLPH